MNSTQVQGQGPSGFWSYVHADDDVDSGRIIRLAEKIQAEYEMLTGGSTIELFVDRSDIDWGSKWRSVIDDALTETAFFIPIVTGRYFRSTECRRELLSFSENAKRRGVPELILPILYSPVQDLVEDSTDAAKATIASTQYIDWTDLRFEDESSPDYRRKVNHLALKIVAIADEVSTRPEQIVVDADEVRSASELNLPIDMDDDSPGILDGLVEVEDGFPVFVKLINEYQEKIEEIGGLFNSYEPKMAKASKVSSGARLLVTKALAAELTPLADDFIDIGSRYFTKAKELDGGINAVLSHFATSGVEESDREAFSEFSSTLRSLASAGEESSESVAGFQAQANEVSSISKDIRRPLRRVAEGSQGFLDGQNFFDAWVSRLDEIESRM